MERVLVTGASQIGKAGVATIVYKWGQHFDSNKIVYDYLMQRGLPDKEYVDAIHNKGGRIYTLSGDRSIRRTLAWITYIVKKYKYKTIHINTDSAYIGAAYIYAAKRGGINHIFVHSHCTEIDDTNKYRRELKTVLHKMCMPYVCANSEKFLACSQLAGYWMFGKRNVNGPKYQTIYNGVEPEKYLYNETVRKKYRSELGIEGKLAIGNIGRFSYQKNHSFLIDVFEDYHKQNQNSVLLLVGEGELREQIEEKVKNLGISSAVIFLGRRNDVPQLLSAMDVMVMPSRFEGLPVTMVEAQMASLPCIVSSNITREAKFMSQVDFISGWNTEKYVQSISKYSDNRDIYKNELLNECRFNVSKAAFQLQSLLLREI